MTTVQASFSATGTPRRDSAVWQAIEWLVDSGSFYQLDALSEHDCQHFGAAGRKVPGDGLVTGHGRIDGRPVLVYAHDRDFLGGSSSRVHAVRIGKLLDMALQLGLPVIGLNDSSGIRIHEGVDAGAQFSEVFHKTVKASGVVPQISVILGDCAGGAAYAPALTDFIVMAGAESTMFLTGPSVIRSATGESVTKEEIGGAQLHAEVTGLAHFNCDGREQAVALVRELLGYLPQNNASPTPRVDRGDTGPRRTPRLERLIPAHQNEPYDVLDVVAEIADNNEFLEIQAQYAPNLVTGFARFGGRTVGVLASQPLQRAGCLDVDSSLKGARFVRLCDSFDIPLLTLLDVPGYLPGREQETRGIIGAGAKLLHAYCEASVPKLAIVLRKAYGGAYPTLANWSATDFTFALEQAEIAVMGPQGAVDIIFRRELAAAADPASLREKLLDEYRAAHANASYSAKKGYVDGLLAAAEVRNAVLSHLQLLADKVGGTPARRHSNIPL
ncbi:acyl-CoA carboxylase subunit beta [Chromobacterium violaceum]|uniref:acyl-CoA carboxylase subunit beta n=1 Tax=Chromobacterium violaceum TaxID=536 RepID=UPI00143D0E43|nr:acyl-CoA carboxylase subunit beta [Chromobacterium violaceum]QIY77872.1 acyl-CoA carboxylase subunit beta [Chromobacterium violaceum]